MNQGYKNTLDHSNNKSIQDPYFLFSQQFYSSSGNSLLNAQDSSNNFLPLSLLKDLDTTEEQEESDEEHDVVYPNHLNDIDGINFMNNNFPWEKPVNKQKLKPPSKKNKEKFYSFDDVHNVKHFQFQKMKQNQMMMQLMAAHQQQQKMYFANQPQSFQFNNFQSSQHFYQQPMPHQFSMPLYNGNYMNGPSSFMGGIKGLGQSNQMRIGGDTDSLLKHKNQFALGEKILSNPKRILSSPVSCLPSQQKKKKEKKKVSSEEFNSLGELLKITNGNLPQFIMTQKGSRDVQKLLYKILPSDLSTLVDNLSSNLSDLMIDKYANYFCQKLIQNCSPELRIQILKSIQARFIEISCNSFGTHSLQSLIEIANMPSEQEVLRQCVETDVMALALDAKGTHVLQKFISCSHENQQGQIPKTLLVNFEKLINNSHGVCVLIKFIHSSTNKTLKEELVMLISQNALEIIQNPFGNYVVQTLLKENDISLCKTILQVICDNFFSLSMQKFSSNVVEHTITLIDEETLKKLQKEVMTGGKLGSMLKNTYGNFVIEKMILRMNEQEKIAFFQELQTMGKDKGISAALNNLLSQ